MEVNFILDRAANYYNVKQPSEEVEQIIKQYS